MGSWKNQRQTKQSSLPCEAEILVEKVRDLSAEELNKAGTDNTESTAPGGRTFWFVRSVLGKRLSEEELSKAASHRNTEGKGSRWRIAGTKALRWKFTWGARETLRRPVTVSGAG